MRICYLCEGCQDHCVCSQFGGSKSLFRDGFPCEICTEEEDRETMTQPDYAERRARNMQLALEGKPHEAMSIEDVMDAMEKGESYVSEAGYDQQIIKWAKLGKAVVDVWEKHDGSFHAFGEKVESLCCKATD